MTRVFVGLGGNLGDSVRLFERAQAALDKLPKTQLVRCSNYYRTTPVGDLHQPDFLNAVVELQTGLEPVALLRGMQRIENGLGRRRESSRRWGPRTIDLDLLLFGRRTVCESELTVPHPRMAERAFVLEPLAELAPDLEVPGLGRISRLRNRLGSSGVCRLHEDVPDSEDGR